MATKKKDAEALGLPIRPFLYTLDQIATILSVTDAHVKSAYIYFEGRTPGQKDKYHMRAIDIAPPDHTPDWRVSQKELVDWMNFKGFRIYEMGTIVS